MAWLRYYWWRVNRGALGTRRMMASWILGRDKRLCLPRQSPTFLLVLYDETQNDDTGIDDCVPLPLVFINFADYCKTPCIWLQYLVQTYTHRHSFRPNPALTILERCDFEDCGLTNPQSASTLCRSPSMSYVRKESIIMIRIALQQRILSHTIIMDRSHDIDILLSRDILPTSIHFIIYYHQSSKMWYHTRQCIRIKQVMLWYSIWIATVPLQAMIYHISATQVAYSIPHSRLEYLRRWHPWCASGSPIAKASTPVGNFVGPDAAQPFASRHINCL